MLYSIFCTQETFLTLCFYAKVSLLSTLKTVVLLNIFEETMIQGFFCNSVFTDTYDSAKQIYEVIYLFNFILDLICMF